MALIKDGVPANDPFVALADDEPAPATGGVIVSLTRFLKERDALLARAAQPDTPLGVRLEATESPEALRAHVNALALIVLVFPGPRDGRAFSWARMLRTRLGFTGEIRASGHYLRDHIAFLTRVGVNGFELTQNLSPEDFAAALGEFTDVYQPSVDGRATIAELRREKNLA